MLALVRVSEFKKGYALPWISAVGQVDRVAAGSHCFSFVSGRCPAFRAIGGAALQGEGGMDADAGGHPVLQDGMVGCDAEFGIVSQSAGDQVQRLGIDETPPFVAAFRPGIREQQEGPGDRAFRKRLKQKTRVLGKDSDIAGALGVEQDEKAGYAIDKWFAADEADFRMGCGLSSEMLPTAETDFEPDFRRERVEQGSSVDKSRRLGQGSDALPLSVRPRRRP